MQMHQLCDHKTDHHDDKHIQHSRNRWQRDGANNE
jgi:hypothetical protein